MKLSEAKARFRIAKKLGFKRIRLGVRGDFEFVEWRKYFDFGNDLIGAMAFTDDEVLMSYFPDIYQRKYDRLWNEVAEKNRNSVHKNMLLSL